MFGFFKRRKERAAELDPRDQQIEQGFRALKTAQELVRQSVCGELPPVNIVEIGDGFYVELLPDGTRKTVVVGAKVTASLDAYPVIFDASQAHLDEKHIQQLLGQSTK